ncbi:TIGR03087 family PEP-CTERM/XrtA system glycosyltransferase [Herbaspirillum robiniae]|uniref:TIGR03087 family PEP-CTERM/XrtA system glycosyltransferase n=1 Tax=Herbaspirillum robiniae TaxID=2014887 RepID=A0ABX2LTD6_9BURK|nr:TIGR03087 family PEP-CTERM/XrtA system glycosyltransferase [Herbaspirillum robiniae]NUU01802.1 TIGR03087 family PEP-CTERM/XrtA system glycosyltransferase [Herbaspirillum robiniae]
MEHLLFLAHRIPYPPNKGDKIRSFHLLKHLAQRYHVHLATFIDDAADWQYADTVKGYCHAAHFAHLDGMRARLRSLPALASTRALSLDYYRNRGLRDWVSGQLDAAPISRVLVFSSVMAQYAQDARLKRSVVDFVDVDSDKWTQYAAKKAWPMNWVYRREGRRLLQYEQRVAAGADVSLFVSQAEAELFRGMAPASAHKIGFLNNGVDTGYFSPQHRLDNPYEETGPVMVFTGAMDYWPNIDAVQWFAGEILPLIRARHPQALFYIVGSRPSAQVQALANLPGVRVTGTVPDVRPYLAHACFAVAPLRVARGIQNKVLEAMAMGMPVLASPQAFEGISAAAGRDLLVADGAAAFAEAAVRLLQDTLPDGPRASLAASARATIEEKYGWDRQLAVLDALLEHRPDVQLHAS